MYKIYADDTLIYDSTIDEYKIGSGKITLETNKSGSFTFSLYPDHFYYDRFVKMKTVVTVYKSNKIVFRGRILNDKTDYWGNKVFTCEGELGFLRDSIVRPFDFSGMPEQLFNTCIAAHNGQVDDFKKFNIGTVTVDDPNDYIVRSNSEYDTTLDNLNDSLVGGSLGGYWHITHGANGTDRTPTIHYLADFDKVSTQTIEFGENLKNYTKTVKAESIATAIIPLGAKLDDGNSSTVDPRLTIADINGGVDFVYSPEGVALYGWIFAVVTWDDVTVAENLKTKAEARLAEVLNQNITVELTAIDLHSLNRSIESFHVNEYIHVRTVPHNFDAVLLCKKQTLDLLKPQNDTVTLGHTYSTFTESSGKAISAANNIDSLRSTVSSLSGKLNTTLTTLTGSTQQNTNDIINIISRLDAVESGVPAGYTALSYIESDGAAFIDTLFKPNNNTRVVFSGYCNAGSSWIYGTWDGNNVNQFAASTLSTYSIRYGTGGASLTTITAGDVSIDQNKAVYSFNGVTGEIASDPFQCSHTMYLFAINAAGSVSDGRFYGKIYSCTIYDNGLLTRDFVPCKNADGVIGLYDKCTRQFFTNAGTGEFTGG